jgi:DNA replication protein DnaC
MTYESLNTLRELKLYGMATAFEAQMNQPNTYDELSFFERLAFLLQQESTFRDHKRLDRLLKQAKFKVNAHLNDVEVGQARGILKQNVASITTLDWFHKHRNIIVTGPTGSGKTHLACAIGRHVCQSGFSVRYYRASRLLDATTAAHADGTYLKLIASLEKTELLIIDDWGLEPLSTAHRHDLLELLEDRHHRKSTIILSQIPVAQWHEYIGDATLADAILDRVIHNAFQLKLKGDSMRKLKNGLAEGEHLG